MCLAFSGVIDSPYIYQFTKFDLNRMLVMDFSGLFVRLFGGSQEPTVLIVMTSIFFRA